MAFDVREIPVGEYAGDEPIAEPIIETGDHRAEPSLATTGDVVAFDSTSVGQ